MRVAISFIFLIITFFGVISQASDACMDSWSSQQHTQHEIFDHEDKSHSDCHQSGSTCRTCHLGHCAFTLSSSISFIASTASQTLVLAKIAVTIFDFHTSLFRPPIS